MSLKAPAEKLPLAARKNVRDEWELKKPQLEEKVSTLLGTSWTFEANPLVIYPYANEGDYGNHSPGACIYSYFEDLESSLKYFVQNHGDAGKDELNSVCYNHVAILTVDPNDKPIFSYCGPFIDDGKLFLYFSPSYLGSNISYIAANLDQALSKAPQPEGAPSLSYIARHSIKTDYEPKVGDLLAKAQKYLSNDGFKFEPDFEAVGAKLKENKDTRDDWERNLGSFTLSYLESFVSYLEYNKFEGDELLQEGLAEGVPKGEIHMRVVDKLAKGSYNEILIDDGALYLQTTPSNWGSNIHNAAEKLLDIL